MMRPTDTWICVADAGRANFFRCDGPGSTVEPLVDVSVGHGHRRDHSRDKDGHKQFAGAVALRIERAAGGHMFDHLVLVAPMPVLSALTSALTPDTRQLIVDKFDKDLVRATPRELATHIRDALPQHCGDPMTSQHCGDPMTSQHCGDPMTSQHGGDSSNPPHGGAAHTDGAATVPHRRHRRARPQNRGL
jgi:protein required for attachment to host cells